MKKIDFDGQGVASVVALARELPAGEPDGDYYAQRDEEPVVAQRERPHLEDHREGRAGYAG